MTGQLIEDQFPTVSMIISSLEAEGKKRLCCAASIPDYKKALRLITAADAEFDKTIQGFTTLDAIQRARIPNQRALLKKLESIPQAP